MTVKERILQLADDKGLSKQAFLKKAGIRRGLLDGDKIQQGVSDRQLVAILMAFPDVNIEWLLTGDGQMYKPTVVLPPDVVSIERYTRLVRENERLRIDLANACKNKEEKEVPKRKKKAAM